MYRPGALVGIAVLIGIATAAAQEPRVRDPMRPFVAVDTAAGQTATETGLQLTAVVISAKRRIAVINGSFYRVGERVGGNEILAIESGSVAILRDGERVLITLNNTDKRAVENDGDQDQ